MFKPQLIQGTVTQLATVEGKRNFVMSGGARAATGAAAAGAAVVGSFFSSSLLARSAISLNEDAVFFTCVVNNVKLSGCFNTLNIQEGEAVEWVVDYNHNKTEGVVYAIRKPKERCLWVVPMMDKGHGMAIRMALFFPLIILKYFLPFAFVFFVIMETLYEGEIQILEPLTTVLGGGGVMYCLMALGACVSYVPKAKLATQVITALGYNNSAYIDLGMVSLNVKEEWEKEHGKPFPADKYDGFTLFY